MKRPELPKELLSQGPHRMVDKALDGVLDGAKGVGNSLIGGLKGAGGGLMGALDQPFAKVTGKSGPHNVLGRALDGTADSVNNALNNGAIGTLEIFGEGISRALDHPLEQLK